MTRSDANPETDSAPRPAEAMGAKLGRGVSWLMVAAALGKAGALFSNIVLGWVLLKEDFGLFAFAAGVAGFASVFRDGGVRQLIIQRGPRRYRRLSGPAFWLSVTMSCAAGGILAVLGPLFAISSGKPVAPLLAVMGLGVALAGAPAVYRGKIAVDLRYRRLAELNALISFTRYGSMIALALMGFGAMSLALPWVIVAVVEFAFGWWVTRDAPWTRRPGFRAWPAILKRTVWLVVGQIGISLINTGDYLVLSLLQAAGVVGLYYFAFQLIDQTNVLLAVSLQTALFPALSVLAGEPKRHAEGVVRSARVMMVVGTALALGTACVIGPLEQLVWRFKWSDAVVPVQILALFFPLRMMMVVYNSALMSRGLFVPRAVQMMVIAAGVMVTAWAVGSLTGSVDHISLAMGAYHGVIAFGFMVLAMRAVDVRPLKLLGAVLPALAIGTGAMAASVWIDAAWVFPAVARAVESAPSYEIPLTIVRVGTLGGVFTALYAAGMRALRRGDLVAVIDVIPARLRRPARRVLALPSG